jgi:hypothetical protein
MEMVICTMCGHRFDPAAHVACRSCPLQSGCQLTCCPACGFEMVNPDRSILARLALRWLSPSKEYSNTNTSQRS